MKKMLFIASALLLTSGIAMAQQNEPQIPYVEINSSADTAVAPNKFRIAISISEAPTKGKTTIAELERSLATALDAAGVDIKNNWSSPANRTPAGNGKTYTNTRTTC